MGSNAVGERENARALLGKLLEKLRLSWNDLPSLLATPETTAAIDDDEADAAVARMPNRALEVVHYIVRNFIDVKPYELVALALWALHTHVADRFLVTPRLALISPVSTCGKSTVLNS